MCAIAAQEARFGFRWPIGEMRIFLENLGKISIAPGYMRRRMGCRKDYGVTRHAQKVHMLLNNPTYGVPFVRAKKELQA